MPKAGTDREKPLKTPETGRVDTQSPPRFDELDPLRCPFSHSGAWAQRLQQPPEAEHAHTESKPGTEQPKERKVPAQSRLDGSQNGVTTCPAPQTRPKSTNLPVEPAPLPKTKPNRTLRGQQPTLSAKLPNPTAGRRTVCQAAALAPLTHTFTTAKNRINTRLHDRRTVTLERNAERRQKTDRHPTARATTAYLTDLNLLHRRKPHRPEISALAFGARKVADRTAGRKLRLNLWTIRRIRLNRASEERR